MDPPVTWRNRTQNFQITTNAKKSMKTGSGNPSITTNPTGVSGTYGFMADNKHPNYLFRLFCGEVIMGDMILQKDIQNYTDAYLSWTIGTTTCTLTGDFGSQVKKAVTVTNGLNEAFIAPKRDATLISAYAKITSDSVMSSEVLIGMAKTVTMLRRPFATARDVLGRMFKSASSSYGKTADSITKANASAWLEYRYGMLPTYLDANQVIKMYCDKNRTLSRKRAVARASSQEYRDNKTISFVDKLLPMLNNIGYELYATGSVDCLRTVVVHSGVVYEVAPRTLAEELAVQFQLGSSAIAPSLWEQIPFSFVADWFYNVGDWLAATNLPPDVTIKGNWTSTLLNFDDTYKCTDFWMMMNSVKRHGSFGSKSYKYFTHDRRTNRPLPTLPSVVDKWSTITHAADACSLLLGPIKELIVKLR